MIVVRSPLRISFVGGGSDIPSYCNYEVGYVVSAAIDRYVHVIVDNRYDKNVRVSYSKTETVDINSIDYIEHDIVRECLKFYYSNVFFIDGSGLDIASLADLPHGSGLGSSGAFTTGLIKALVANNMLLISDQMLAENASVIEMVKCGKPIGYQDQSASAFGGLNKFIFSGNKIAREDLWNPKHVRALESRVLLVDTGSQGSSTEILKRQSVNIGSDSITRASVRSMANLALAFTDSFREGLIDDCCAIVDASWSLKKSIDKGITNLLIDSIHEYAMSNGALGGKLCGAGGRGMFLVMCQEGMRDQLSNNIESRTSLRTIKPQFSPLGATVVWSSR